MALAMPERYFEIGLEKVGLLMDGKDCVTDTVRVNSFVSRAQYSDKMHCSAARYIMWVLPCGLSVTYTPLFLGRVSEKALVEYWGGSTYDMLHEYQMNCMLHEIETYYLDIRYINVECNTILHVGQIIFLAI